MRQDFKQGEDILIPTDLDKFHEQKAREFFQTYLAKKTISDFVTAEEAFVSGFLRGVDYGKATFDKRGPTA